MKGKPGYSFKDIQSASGGWLLKTTSPGQAFLSMYPGERAFRVYAVVFLGKLGAGHLAPLSPPSTFEDCRKGFGIKCGL